MGNHGRRGHHSEHDLPGQSWDSMVRGIIGLACIPFILGNVVLLYNRKYRPIKTKSVNLTVLSSVGGLIWMGATLVAHGHLRRHKHSIWAICPLWSFWLQGCFGFCLWLNCMNVHLIVLYYIFVLKRAAGGMKFNMTKLAVLLSPTIVFCISASAAPSSSRFVPNKRVHPPASSPGPEGDCKINISWALGLLSLLVLYFLIFLGLAFKLRGKAMVQYNEFRIIRNGVVMSMFQFLLFLVTMQTRVYYHVVGRSFLSLSVSSAVFYYFWARNGEVIYNVIFHKEEYARKFNADLQRCPSERDSRENFPSSFQDMETEVREAREAINHYHNQIEQLKEEVCAMEQRVSDLQQQVELLCSQVIKETEMSKSLDWRLWSL